VTYRFHVPGIPHTATNKDYLCCAFTQKVLNLCKMLCSRGHTVIHYGNELSLVRCTEHVTVTAEGDIGPPELSGKFDQNSPTYHKFYAGCIDAISQRKQPRDFLLCMWGSGHKPIADAHPDLIAVEPGIGYPGGHFANFKVFESYALLHAYYGLEAVASGNKLGWYNVVIPNYYDIADFEVETHKSQDLLFLGRRLMDNGAGKGIDIAIDVAKAANRRLIIAGPGAARPFPEHVHAVGFLDLDARKHWLSRARALLAPSLFIEPFCGASVEAMLCGTPVVSSDWGAFAENNIHGITGWRCRTFEQFVWAVNAGIDQLSPRQIGDYASEQFSLERVGEMYEEYFWSVMNVFTGAGWYEPKSNRYELDWLWREPIS
jgi:glycosyltransferase involved in cell wall biosynthesis